MRKVSAIRSTWQRESRRRRVLRRERLFSDICSVEEARHVKTEYMLRSWDLWQLIFFVREKTNRVVGYKNGEYVDYDIEEALAMKKTVSEYQYEVAKTLAL